MNSKLTDFGVSGKLLLNEWDDIEGNQNEPQNWQNHDDTEDKTVVIPLIVWVLIAVA